MDQAEAVAIERAALDAPEPAGKERYNVQSLERAFAILEAIVGHENGISLADLSKLVDLHNSTAFHLVRTMVQLGYVRQDATTKRYHLGRMIYALAASSHRELELVGVATPILEEISQRTGESVHLALLLGSEVSVVARTSGTSAFQLQERNGGIRPGHATALGKILLAALPEKKLDIYLQGHPMTALTPRTLTDPGQLRKELATVRTMRVAYDDGESHPEVRCLAVPVYDFTGNVFAAIGLSGPVWRMTLQSLNEFGEILKDGAARITTEIGGHAPRVKTGP